MTRKRVFRCPNCNSEMRLDEEGGKDCANRYGCTNPKCCAYAVFCPDEVLR